MRPFFFLLPIVALTVSLFLNAAFSAMLLLLLPSSLLSLWKNFRPNNRACLSVYVGWLWTVSFPQLPSQMSATPAISHRWVWRAIISHVPGRLLFPSSTWNWEEDHVNYVRSERGEQTWRKRDGTYQFYPGKKCESPLSHAFLKGKVQSYAINSY